MSELSRRQSLGLLSATSACALSGVSFAKGIAKRKFIFVMLRGAMDGLSALIPDDPEIDALRGAILPSAETRLTLGNGFRLHPSFTSLKTLYASGDAAFIHAAATSYRDRSHFEAQDALETLSAVGAKEGWLNRALQLHGGTGLAVGHIVPLALTGRAPTSNWSPPIFKSASDAVIERLSDMYKEDALFAATLAAAQSNEGMSVDISKRDARRFSREYTTALSSIGRFMQAKGGPGIGMIALDGWDTHAGQNNQLTRKFTALDEGLAALKTALGASWDKSCVVVCSEFGRTAAANGTKGTDHGTGGLTMLLGGAVKGGKIYGDWPGVKAAELYEGRDLFPANDIAAILKGILRDHLGLDRRMLENNIFPNSEHAFEGLIKV